jgi:hypothetical protein
MAQASGAISTIFSKRPTAEEIVCTMVVPLAESVQRDREIRIHKREKKT